MTATDLFQAGRLDEAVAALGVELRRDPTDSKRRTFLFELLCFSGEYDRAEKQLDILADSSHEAAMGSLLYRSALQAERTRRRMFETGDFPHGAAPPAGGQVDDRLCESIEDADPRLGARLEVYAAGAYLWIPFEHISSLEIQPPKRLRDLLWIPALLHTSPAFKGRELGEVLLPVLTPLAWKHPDAEVRLGRQTQWQESADGKAIPAGQKLFLADEEEYPILEVRRLQFSAPPVAAEETQA
jgi:type VI secretion system protein ImpE